MPVSSSSLSLSAAAAAELIRSPIVPRTGTVYGTCMPRYEYNLHSLKLKTKRTTEDQILAALSRFGKEGCRLNRVQGEARLRSLARWKGKPNILLEREVVQGEEHAGT